MIKIKGLKELEQRIKNAPEEWRRRIGGELSDLTLRVARKAIRDAPVDQGKLRSGISGGVKKGELTYAVVSSANYSGYLEFGTKSRVNKIPAGLEQVASAMRGKGPKLGKRELFNIILRWVHRKGIAGTFSVKTRRRRGSKITQYAEDYSVAYLIYRKIVRYGIEPHPFFYKNFTEAEQKETIDDIEKILAKI